MNNSHTNTFFHYTNSLDTVISILENVFRFSYAKEEFHHGRIVGIPMISFCDIPITLSGEHKGKYGEFAIGIAKSNLIADYPITPVTYILNDRMDNLAFKLHSKYICNESFLDSSMDDLAKSGAAPLSVKLNGNNYTGYGMKFNEVGRNIFKTFIDNLSLNQEANSLLGSMKLYKFKRNGEEQINYDECEWRLVYPENAKINDSKCKWIWEKYDVWKTSREDKFLSGAPTLNPIISDINYLIVPTEKDIFPLITKISKLGKVFGEDLSDESRSILYSKILSFEKIEKDF